MIFVSCPTCRRLIPASPTQDGMFRCNKCARPLDPSQARRCACSKCDNVAYVPSALPLPPALPCHPEAAMIPVSVAQPFAAEAAKRAPVLRCSCGASLSGDWQLGSHGRLPSCAVCGKTISNAEFSKQLYFLNNEQEPIQLTWKPDADSLYYRHDHGGNIPPLSLLIVDPMQLAVYISGGRHVTLGSGTYALFGEEMLQTDEISRMINQSDDVEPLTLQVNTSVIFFDTRAHQHQEETVQRISKLQRTLYLPYTYNLSLINPETYMHNADALTSSSKLSDMQRQVKLHVDNWISEVLDSLPAEALRESASTGLRSLLRERCESEKGCTIVNRMLSSTGMAISDLFFDYQGSRLEEAKAQSAAPQSASRPAAAAPRRTEEMLLETIRARRSANADPASYMDTLLELWDDYQNPSAGLMLVALSLGQGRRSDATDLYNQLRRMSNRLTPDQQQKLRSLESHIFPRSYRP